MSNPIVILAFAEMTKKPMKDSSLLVIFATLFIVASTTLALRESFLADPTNHDWWSLSFISEETTDSSFSVINYGTTKTFFYEATIGDTIVESASFTISGGNGQTIVIANPDKQPIRVTVWIENETNKESKELGKRKEIYKR